MGAESSQLRGQSYRKVRAGVYEHASSGRLIVRTDAWEGPRGGEHSLWEFAEQDERGQITVDGLSAYRTLRDAKREMSRQLEEAIRNG